MNAPVPLLPRSVRWLVVALVAGFIFYASLGTVPETAVDETNPGGAVGIDLPLNLWRHVVAYFGLAGALAYATDHWEMERWQNAALVIGIAALYGVCMEFGQTLVPHRTEFLLTDVAANTVGAAGVLVWYLLRPHLELKPVRELADWY